MGRNIGRTSENVLSFYRQPADLAAYAANADSFEIANEIAHSAIEGNCRGWGGRALRTHEPSPWAVSVARAVHPANPRRGGQRWAGCRATS